MRGAGSATLRGDFEVLIRIRAIAGTAANKEIVAVRRIAARDSIASAGRGF